jgi:hypothetical protein
MDKPQGRVLVPQDVLLRALLGAKMSQDLSLAFMLRKNERGSGLSVNFDLTPQQCQARFNCSFGVVTLTVQDVANAAQQTNLPLQVIPDEPNHANITGVPYKEDDPVGAERAASELARHAVLVIAEKVDNSKAK